MTTDGRTVVMFRGVKMVAEECGFCDGVGCDECLGCGYLPTRGSIRRLRDKLMGEITMGDRSLREAQMLLERHETLPDEMKRHIWLQVNPKDARRRPATIDRLIAEQHEAFKKDLEANIAQRVIQMETIDLLDSEMKRINRARALAESRRKDTNGATEIPVESPPVTKDTCTMCDRSAVAWGADGNGWCKRHAYAEGVLWNEPDILEGE
jgi:hypothetical protein